MRQVHLQCVAVLLFAIGLWFCVQSFAAYHKYHTLYRHGIPTEGELSLEIVQFNLESPEDSEAVPVIRYREGGYIPADFFSKLFWEGEPRKILVSAPTNSSEPACATNYHFYRSLLWFAAAFFSFSLGKQLWVVSPWCHKIGTVLVISGLMLLAPSVIAIAAADWALTPLRILVASALLVTTLGIALIVYADSDRFLGRLKSRLRRSRP
ncbi:MAG: hypothetical protein ACKVT0_05075 [Planctomycetaceae bacterium]